MATLTIRDVDEALKRQLRLRAAQRNRSMEEEVRQILRTALAQPLQDEPVDLGQRIHARFAGLGGDALQIPEREPLREPPDLRARQR